ncbi:MAG: hypothetical protein ACTSPI_01270 [Candidatus Heimdallarchaeaceae archaeon]
MGKHKKHRMQSTSLLAHENIKKKLGERQAIVLKAISELCGVMGDCTDSEITSHLIKQDPNYVRPRRWELVNKLKFVAFSQQRKCKITGETVLAWRILQGGTDEVEKMPKVRED